MTRFIGHWLAVGVSLGVAAWVLPGVHVDSITALLVGSFVLGFVNAVVRPVLTWLTLPLTIVTLGLFYLVVNGLAFGLAAFLVPGFGVSGFGWAVLGALLVSVMSAFIGGSGDRKRRRERD
jgi:putative membrane protein